ncbi:MAG: hypothetical protein K2L39_01535 [Muribaculaceae bacterium]|nr:hypothetical protein [Muribaculaceae bacterium]MDE6359893.1 hypothetical protein [Muribaculaceae bacterium]
MRKEFGKWLMDIAKYITTAVILSSVFGQVNTPWIIYLVGAVSVTVTLWCGLHLIGDSQKPTEKKSNDKNK